MFRCGPQAFHWTAESGMLGLGFLLGSGWSTALAASADGSVIVGYSDTTLASSSCGVSLDASAGNHQSRTAQCPAVLAGQRMSQPTEAWSLAPVTMKPFAGRQSAGQRSWVRQPALPASRPMVRWYWDARLTAQLTGPSSKAGPSLALQILRPGGCRRWFGGYRRPSRFQPGGEICLDAHVRFTESA